MRVNFGLILSIQGIAYWREDRLFLFPCCLLFCHKKVPKCDLQAPTGEELYAMFCPACGWRWMWFRDVVRSRSSIRQFRSLYIPRVAFDAAIGRWIYKIKDVYAIHWIRTRVRSRNTTDSYNDSFSFICICMLLLVKNRHGQAYIWLSVREVKISGQYVHVNKK